MCSSGGESACVADPNSERKTSCSQLGQLPEKVVGNQVLRKEVGMDGWVMSCS